MGFPPSRGNHIILNGVVLVGPITGVRSPDKPFSDRPRNQYSTEISSILSEAKDKEPGKGECDEAPQKLPQIEDAHD